jgi:hypothetical protein
MSRTVLLRPFCLLVAGLLAGVLPVLASEPLRVAATAAPAPLLPQSFAGWQLQGALDKTADPQTVDALNAQVLVEYGFRDFASGSYHEPGNTLSVRALRFGDSTGAYGAYTFYRIPGMHPEEIGRGAAANGKRILFWNGATLVDASFDHLTAMSAAELRELATRLPVPNGAADIPPSLPGYLPRQNLDVTHTRYALGPVAYERTGGVLPPSLVDFNRSPEAMTAEYTIGGYTGDLTLIEYPTPQIAADRERAIHAYLEHQSVPLPPAPGKPAAAATAPSLPWTQALTDSNPGALLVRRSGLLVAVTSGGFAPADARNLIDRINYEASVTWNHPQGYVPETTKAARLLVGIFALCMFLCGGAVLLAVFLGGTRVVVRKLQGKPLSSLEETEFIKLNLR